MAASSGAKVVPYILVLPSPPPSPSPPNEHDKNDHRNRRRDDAAWLPETNCSCLSSFFGGLCLTTLLIAAIAIPLMITISISKTQTASSASTTLISTTPGTPVTTFTTSTVTTTTTTSSTSTSSKTTTSVTTSTATTTDIPCSTTCTSQQTCVRGTCVGTGYLSCTLTWSRIGDGDIVVETPNNDIIYYGDTGPSYYTDYGELDVDNKNGTGPENVFWPNSGSVPPTGVYYVCFSQYSFVPVVSPSNPITATVTVEGSGSTTLTFTKTFTTYYKNYYSCDSTSAGFLGSFIYP